MFRCCVDRAIAEWKLNRLIAGSRVKVWAGEALTSYRPTSSRSRSPVGLRAMVLRVAIAADRRTYISWAESVQSALGGYPRKAASAALCSSYVSGFASVIAVGQCLAVIGRGSWPADFRRPQFKHANTVIASPAFRSTARSGNIAPRHLSQIVISTIYHA